MVWACVQKGQSMIGRKYISQKGFEVEVLDLEVDETWNPGNPGKGP